MLAWLPVLARHRLVVPHQRVNFAAHQSCCFTETELLRRLVLPLKLGSRGRCVS